MVILKVSYQYQSLLWDQQNRYVGNPFAHVVDLALKMADEHVARAGAAEPLAKAGGA